MTDTDYKPRTLEKVILKASERFKVVEMGI